MNSDRWATFWLALTLIILIIATLNILGVFGTVIGAGIFSRTALLFLLGVCIGYIGYLIYLVNRK